MCNLVGCYHLVGCNQQMPWDREPEHPCGLAIDDQFDLRVLLDGKVGRFLAP
jgi:hypothetical protein